MITPLLYHSPLITAFGNDQHKLGQYQLNVNGAYNGMPQNQPSSNQFAHMPPVQQQQPMGFPQGMGFPPPGAGQMLPSMGAFNKMQQAAPPVAAVAPPTTGKGSGAARFKKAPDAPKRFKSAFIIFSAEKHKEIKVKLTAQGRQEKVSQWSGCGVTAVFWLVSSDCDCVTVFSLLFSL
jgi:hypothetical protein